MAQKNLNSVTEAFQLQSEAEQAVILYSLSECPPCVIAKEALDQLAEHPEARGWDIFRCSIDKNDKKELGSAFLKGINTFPTIRFVKAQTVISSYSTIPDGWTADTVASFLQHRIGEI